MHAAHVPANVPVELLVSCYYIPLICLLTLLVVNTTAPVPIQLLPVDIHPLLPAGLDMLDICRLSATCTFFRRECELLMDARMRAAFDWLGLDWVTFRFMLEQTGAVVGGFFVYHLVRMDFARMQALSTVDLFVLRGSAASHVNRFFKASTPYRKVRC